MSNIINGLRLSKSILSNISEITAQIKGRRPNLHIINVGRNPSSLLYIRNKIKFGKQCGINVSVSNLPSSTTFDEVKSLIERFNTDQSVDGLLTQLPLEISGITSYQVTNLIDSRKDVDGLNAYNISRLARGHLDKSRSPQDQDFFLNGNLLALFEILQLIKFNTKGSRTVVVGNGQLIGCPISDFMNYYCDSTVTHLNEHSQNIAEHIAHADILITGIGKAHYIKGDWLKPGSVVIDFGISYKDERKIYGDVEFSKAVERAKWITPVPKGVGPLTVAMLMKNVLNAFYRNIQFTTNK